MAGEFGSANVPKKAIAAQEIIYQTSTLLAATAPVVYSTDYDELTYKIDVTKGVLGHHDVQMDAAVSPERLDYTQLSKNLKWSRYDYMITDGSKLLARDEKAMWNNSMESAADYFATLQDYLTITALAAGAANNHTASNYWNTADGDPELDLVTAISKIMTNSNVRPTERIAAILPMKAYMELNKLTLVGNVQQKLGDYMKGSFSLDLIGYRPFINSSGAQLDALDNDAIVCVEGKNTCHYIRYDPSVAARAGVPLVEQSRIHGRGDLYTQKMASEALVMWDGIQSSSTTAHNARIYKIANVVATAL